MGDVALTEWRDHYQQITDYTVSSKLSHETDIYISVLFCGINWRNRWPHICQHQCMDARLGSVVTWQNWRTTNSSQ